jgi:PLP dependent protein
MSISINLDTIRQRALHAARLTRRSADDITLIAVSKTRPSQMVTAAHQAGQLHFGENYAQELRDKAREIPKVHWHFIGRIQTNKVRYIAPVAYRIHTLETLRQAEALSRRAPSTLHCLVSVNIGGEDSKSGVEPAKVIERCIELNQVPKIEVTGLMCMPPYTEDPEDTAPFFQEMAHLAEQGRARGLSLHELSMGMSHDFEVAIRYGATWIRVGTAIFGPRQLKA